MTESIKVSVITPTIRPEGLKIVYDSLKKQTYTNWEWLIGSKFNPDIPDALWVEDDFDGGYWTLNRMWNALFKHCRGTLVVFWQDWIYIPSDGIEKFISAYTQYPDGIFTGVGDQYERVNKWNKPEVKIWSDPRKTEKYGSFYEINWNDIEYNWAACSKQIIKKIGGADEKLDFLGYGADLLQMSDRLNDAGYHFWIDQTNESFTIRHGRERDDWDINHVLKNGMYDKRKINLMTNQCWPILPCLEKDGELNEKP